MWQAKKKKRDRKKVLFSVNGPTLFFFLPDPKPFLPNGKKKSAVVQTTQGALAKNNNNKQTGKQTNKKTYLPTYNAPSPFFGLF